MLLRKYRTNRPNEKAGGFARCGVIALAALLLACVLMVGAVSAEEWNVVTTADDLRSNLTAGNNVRLGESFTDAGTFSLVIENVSSVLDLNGMTLTFSEITTTAIAIGNDTASKKGSLIIQDSVGNGKISAPKGFLFFVRNASTLTLNAGSFDAESFVVSSNANGQWNDPTITIGLGVELTTMGTAVYIPAQGSTVTITGTTINGSLGGICVASGDVTITDTTINVSGKSEPRWNNRDGSADDGSAVVVQKKSSAYKGDINLKLLGNTIVNGPTADALHNYLRKNPDDPGKTTVTIADTVQFNGALRSYQYNSATSDIGGILQSESGEILLYPGLNQEGVVWGGDATSGYTLAISKSGSYKLMEDFAYVTNDESSSILTLDTVDVKLNLNGKTITGSTNHATAAFVMVKNQGSLTVTGNGAIKITGPYLYMFSAASESDLTLESGTFTATGTIASGNGLSTDTQMIISGGTLTSTEAPVVFMPSTQTLIINGTAALSGPVGVDIKTGAVTINENAKITATGTGTGAIVPSSNGPVDGENSAIVLERTSVYTGDLVLTIGNNAQLSSHNGAAIRNYIRPADLATSATPVITIQDNATLSGTVTIENRKYTYDQVENVVGTFNLNGGFYKAADKAHLLKSVAPVYRDGYTMSTEPVRECYYIPTKATPPVIVESVTPKDDGTVDIAPISGGSLTVDGKTVTLTASGTAGADNSIVLNVTYAEGATVETGGASGPVASVQAEYKGIPLEDTTDVFNPTVGMTIALTNVDTNLPNITGKLGEAKQNAVQKFGSAYSTFKMGPAFVASHEKLMEFNGNVSTITMTFLVPKSWAAVAGNIGVAHINDAATPVVTTNGITLTTVDNGDGNWKVTATSTKGFSGYATYYGVRVGPNPPPVGDSSSSGNMENALRVLFDANGGSFVQPATGLSYGDRIANPADPERNGYNFAGWYKDEAGTIAWIFSEDAVPGDITLYAKWVSVGSTVTTTTEPTKSSITQATAKSTTSQTASVTQSALPSATTGPVGISPTMTQAPAPLAGLLFGLLGGCILIRRRSP